MTSAAGEVRIGQYVPKSAAARCLVPLLDALGWRGDSYRLAESLPRDASDLCVDQLQNTLAILGYESIECPAAFGDIDERMFPCVFYSSDTDVFVMVKDAGDGSVLSYDGKSATYKQITRNSMKGFVLYFKTSAKRDTLQKPAKHWFTTLFLRFRPMIISALAVSLILSLLSLVSPLFVKTVYDLVLGTPTPATLLLLGIGILIYIVTEAGFMHIRHRMQNYLSARMGNVVGTEVLRRLLYLPPHHTENAPLGGQLARIRDFESVRDFFGGPAAAAILDFPFTIILVVGMALISGPLVVIPLVALFILLLFGVIVTPMVQRANLAGAAIISKKQELLLELLTGLRGIKYAGLSRIWKDRFKATSAEAAVNSYTSSKLLVLIDAVATTVVALAGLLTMVWGVFRVEAGTLTAGALMASMMLVWRVMAPLKTGFAVLTQINRVYKSVSQLDRLMEMPIEAGSMVSSRVRPFKGNISFSQVSMRYAADLSPAIISLSGDIPAGSFCVICGHGGSGKSTILKLILGMYQPLAGRIAIDSFNIRQMDPLTLRRGISYLPQFDRLFSGTIASNVALADPSASPAAIEAALTEADIMHMVMGLPAGLDTHVSATSSHSLPATITRGISLARLYLHQTPITMIDSPENGLTASQLEKLRASIKNREAGRTVIMVSGDRELISSSDQVLWIDQGRLKYSGRPKEMLSSYFGDGQS